MKHFMLVFAIFLFATGVFAQSNVQKGATVEGITEYKLDNGLRVLLFPDPSKPTVTVNITYLVGSKHENYGETGMAHLLEHMVFKGTPKHPNVKEEITSRGNRWNGTTWYDRTNYFETMQASDENLEWAIEMEADRMIHSFVSKKDLESEMTVVRNEFEMGENSPLGVLWDRIVATAFLWHNYGKSTIGARSDVENVPIDRLQAFYKKYYQPDNAVLMITGKFDEQKALGYVSKYFGAIPKPERQLSNFYTQDPTQDGERSVVLRRTGTVQFLGVGYHVPSGVHSDFASISLASNILGSTPSGRLYKALVDSKKAANVFNFDFQLAEPGILLYFAEVLKDQSVDEAKQIMLQTIDDLSKNPPTVNEVERARNEILKQIDQTFQSSENICIELSEWIGMGDWRMFFINRDRIKAVKPEDVVRVAKYYFKPDNRTVGIFYPTDKPDRTEIPATPDIKSLVADYKGGEAIAAGEDFDPSVQNILARTTYTNLKNGAKIALLPKKTRGETIRISITMPYGDLESLKNKGSITPLTASMLNKGTNKRTRQEIDDELDKLKSSISIYGWGYFTNVTIQTDRKNLVATLNLLREVLREPSFPAEELEKVKLEEIASIDNQLDDAGSVAFNMITRHMQPYEKSDVRYTATFEEQKKAINSATQEQVKQFYTDFYGMDAATIAVVGDFDDKEVKSLLEQSFGDWKSPKPYKQIKNQLFTVAPLNEKIEMPDKTNAFFVIAQSFPLDPNAADYPALEIGNYILGGSFQGRVLQRIREKDGLSYGGGVFLDEHPIDKIGTLTGYAIYAPENLEKLESAFKEEIANLLKNGVTPEELAEAKKTWKQEREVNIRAQDPVLARRLSLYMEWKRPLQWDADLEAKVDALTPAQVNASLKKYLDLNKMSIVKSGDFAKSKVSKP